MALVAWGIDPFSLCYSRLDKRFPTVCGTQPDSCPSCMSIHMSICQAEGEVAALNEGVRTARDDAKSSGKKMRQDKHRIDELERALDQAEQDHAAELQRSEVCLGTWACG